MRAAVKAAATKACYPDVAEAIPFDMYTEEIAQHKIESAEKILAWVRKLMG